MNREINQNEIENSFFIHISVAFVLISSYSVWYIFEKVSSFNKFNEDWCYYNKIMQTSRKNSFIYIFGSLILLITPFFILVNISKWFSLYISNNFNGKSLLDIFLDVSTIG